jgi:hypothetical protein
MADTRIEWVQLCMSHLPEVVAAQEPDRGGIAPLLGSLCLYLLASWNSVIIPNGSSLPLGLLEAKGDIMRELLSDKGGGPGPMFPPFHWGPLHWIQTSGRLEWLSALEGHMVADLMTQVLRCGGSPISFLLLCH